MNTASPARASTADTRGRFLRALIGRPGDWIPELGLPLQRSHLLGPLLILATFAISAIPFVGIDGDGLGLGVGTASILAMTWTFLLSVRLRWSEWAFGGLDRVYIAHRWLGIVAIVLMWWHVQSRNTLGRGGVPGADEDVASTGTDLAGIAELWLYILVIASILRLLPWRIWRWTHKLMVIPFAFASFHMLTAEKPFANLSPWGIWFAIVIAVGIAAFLVRVIGRDIVLRGTPHLVAEITPRVRSVELRLRPEGRPMRRRVGQFAFVKLRLRGASEPHPFSIASAPDDDDLVFMIRELGDWTSGVGDTVRVGDRVHVEGPYGHLALRPRTRRPVVWVAGGVGITPFLSDLAGGARADADPPTLLYAVRSKDEAHALDRIEQAAAEGRVVVHYFESRRGTPLTADALQATVGDTLQGAHVVVCGPAPMIRWVRRTARRAGARTVEAEQFDLRGGIGPDTGLALLPRLRRR